MLFFEKSWGVSKGWSVFLCLINVKCSNVHDKRNMKTARDNARYWLVNVMCALFACIGSVEVVGQDVVLTIEAEDATLSGSVKVKSGNNFSGGQFVGDNGVGSKILLENVEVVKEGGYKFRTYYTCMGKRSIAVRTGYYPAVVCTVEKETSDWDNGPTAMMECYLYLNEGENDIEITPYNGDGPNIDKFEIVSIDAEFPRPEPDKWAWGYDLTEDALSVTFNGEPADDRMLDNDEETVYDYTGTAATLQVECDMPYLLTGYYLSAGFESETDVATWRLEYSSDGTTWKALTPSSVQQGGCGTLFVLERNVRDAGYAATHYRLYASGGTIGEVQLFGIPYLSEATDGQFPADLTEGLDVRTYTNGMPLGVYDYGSWDERYYNLFNHDMTKKYYWDGQSTFFVDVELPGTTRLTSYTLTSCQDYPERDPKSWVVEGFDRDWEVVSEVYDFTFPVRYATMKFEVDAEKYYRGFRLRTLESNGAEAFQVLKWQLFGETRPTGLDDVRQAMPVWVSGRELVMQPTGRGQYRVSDLSGRTVAHGQLDGVECRCVLPVGLYVVNMQTEGGSRVEKVIVR